MSLHTAGLQDIMQEVDPQKHAAMLQDYLNNLKMGDMRKQALGTADMFGADLIAGAGELSKRYVGAADDLMNPVRAAIVNRMGGIGAGGATSGLGKLGAGAARFAAGPQAKMLFRAIPGLGAAGAALGVGDIIFGGDSAGNKAMDAGLMAAGGVLGMVGGPLGAAAGAGVGKMVSDGIQFVVGGGKSPEQQRMEQALNMLQSGRIG